MNFLESWYEEKRSAYLYTVLVTNETNPARKKLFVELSKLAEKQASIWEKEIAKTNLSLPKFHPDFRTKVVEKLIHLFGPRKIKPILSAMKVRGMSAYLNSESARSTLSLPHQEHRHKSVTTAGNLRAGVFGVNDGLVSNMSLLLGVYGASVDQHVVLLSGIAGLLAGACSMAAGEYISVKSQREFYEYQIAIEKDELQQYPQEEAAELAAIYRSRGIPPEESENLAHILISQPDKALETLAREELGLNPQDLGSPTGAALSSFATFTIGAFIPLIPFLFGTYNFNLFISMGLTAIALFSVGATLSLYTCHNAFKSGFRMLLIGVVAGGLTYAVGHLIGNLGIK